MGAASGAGLVGRRLAPAGSIEVLGRARSLDAGAAAANLSHWTIAGRKVERARGHLALPKLARHRRRTLAVRMIEVTLRHQAQAVIADEARVDAGAGGVHGIARERQAGEVHTPEPGQAQEAARLASCLDAGAVLADRAALAQAARVRVGATGGVRDDNAGPVQARGCGRAQAVRSIPR